MNNTSRRYITSAIFGVLALAAFVYASGSFSISPAFGGFFNPNDTTKAAPKGPRISIDEIDHDFNKIEQQSTAQTNFKITNTGTDTLAIVNAQPSCGCTAAVLGDKRIAPGKSTELHVTFDPHNKAEGPFTKTITITSNSVVEPQKQIRIHGIIYRSKLAHKEVMHLDGVFQGNCATCHVDKGKGELGAKLYEADCAVCHGSKADNKPGPDIASDTMMSHTADQWKKIIVDGIANTNMPAFHTKNKGPLGDEEIASLVDYLAAFKKNMMREKAMKNGGASMNVATPKGTK